MSHVATVDLHIKDLNALARAAAQCGLVFKENQKTYKWWGRWVNDYHEGDAAYKNGIKPEDYGKCEHALSVEGDEGAYEVGIVKRPDGKPGYTIIFDFVDRRLMNRIATPEKNPVHGGIELKNANKLRQAYAEQVAQAKAREQGFRVLRSLNEETGKLTLRCVRA